MSAVAEEIELLVGHKGGGKGGGGGGRVAQEDPNTLRSNATARIIDIVGEGPIVGLVDGFRSMYLDETPVQNDDGSFNFYGLRRADRFGLPDQTPFPRQPGVGRPKDVSAQVTEIGSIVRTISNLAVDAVRIVTQIPQLTYQDPKTGDLHGTSVEYAIDVLPNGGSWVEQLVDTVEGKTTAPYQRSRRVDLVGEGPWSIRHRRVTPDSDKSNVQNETFWASYSELIDAKLIYPDTAGFGVEVGARQFGDSVPGRKYDVKGLIISVPSNYDPETRTYSGLWDGTFKQAWTDNPAWCYFDIATNARYGVGLRFVDKWSLYEIARYCDELVDDGFGGQEPRYAFNTVISAQADVYDALNQLASVFRGMTYWGTNTVVPVADMPGIPEKLVTPANVIEGKGGCFEYSGASRSGRHSAWLVSYNDPDSNDRLVPEIVEDEERIQRFGWKPANLTAVGCNSRGQARRVGLWARETERNEGETVTYTGTSEHAKLRPGAIIRVSDPQRAGARLGGRFLQVGTSVLTLDKVPEQALGGDTWYLDAMLPSGGSERREVASFDDNTVTLTQPLSQVPVHGAIWILASASVEPRQFRVIGNRESGATAGKLRYTITALEHDPTKYARVEQGIYLEPPLDSLIPTGPITPPSKIDVTSYTYIAGGTQHQALTVSVSPSDDVRVQNYIIETRGPTDSGWHTASNGASVSVDVLDATAGEWQTRARAADGIGQLSAWVYRTVNVNGLLLPAPPDSVDISVSTFTAQITPAGLTPGAVWEFWMANAPLNDEQIESNAVRSGVGSSIALTDLHPDTLYYLYIRGVNVYGQSDWYPLQFTTENEPDAILKALSKDIAESKLQGSLLEAIPNLTGDENTAGSVAYQVAQEAQARADLKTYVQADYNGKFGAVSQDISVKADQSTVDAIYALRLQSTTPDGTKLLAGVGYGIEGGTSRAVFNFNQIAFGDTDVNPTYALIKDGNRIIIDDGLISKLTFGKLQDGSGNFIVDNNGRLKAQYIDVDNLQVNYGLIVGPKPDEDADSTSRNTAKNIVGQGAFATTNEADWDTQITGSGKPANNADVTDYFDSRTTNQIEENGVTTIARPGGAARNGYRDETGFIKITLPQSWTETMMSMTIDVYVYTTDKSFTLFVGGYNFGDIWVNTSAVLSGNVASDNAVRFGHDGSKCCILIGNDTNSNWNYSKVVVRDFKAGHNNTQKEKWADGWDVSIVNSLPANIDSYYPDALLDARSIKYQGSLATSDNADWGGQVSGSGKPADNADVTDYAAAAATAQQKADEAQTAAQDYTNIREQAMIDGVITDAEQDAINAASTDATNKANAAESAAETAAKSYTQGWSNQNADVTGDNAAKTVYVSDTRDDNQPPSWYFNNYPKQIVSEFKDSSAIGLTGVDDYVALTTHVGWTGSSGDPVRQTVPDDNGIYTRYGFNGWTAWTRADETGSNTSNDTNNVAGTSAGTVLDRATAANNLTTHWAKPGTTEILPGRISTDEAWIDTAIMKAASVDTLQVRGEAVTLPLFVEKTNQVTHTAGNSWATSLLSMYISAEDIGPNGAFVELNSSIFVQNYFNATASKMRVKDYGSELLEVSLPVDVEATPTGGYLHSASGALSTRTFHYFSPGSHNITMDLLLHSDPQTNARRRYSRRYLRVIAYKDRS